MSTPKRVLICEFHQENNTFNPITTPFERFHPTKTFEGEERYQGLRKARGMVQGTIDAIEAAGGEVIPSVFMHAGSGGRVADEVFAHLCERMTYYAENNENAPILLDDINTNSGDAGNNHYVIEEVARSGQEEVVGVLFLYEADLLQPLEHALNEGGT